VGKGKEVRRLILAGIIALGFTAPAGAFFGPLPVIDAASIAKLTTEVTQAINLVNMAKTNLATLPAGVGLSNISGRISAVTDMLTSAQSVCKSALAGKALPSACNVQANQANAAAAQFGSEMASLQSLQALARGTGGALQAQQATAQAALEVATQLQELRQAQTAAALQKQIDEQAIQQATSGMGSDPWGP
jgi:hypothetical protein